MLAPERYLPFAVPRLATSHAATPRSRRIEAAQGWQRIGLPLAERRIERSEFAHHHADQPAIADEVVLRHQQHMLLVGKVQQTSTDQRTLRKIERRRGFPRATSSLTRYACSSHRQFDQILFREQCEARVLRVRTRWCGTPSSNTMRARSPSWRATRRSSAAFSAERWSRPDKRSAAGMW